MPGSVEMLQYLSAGLIASWVFYGLTPYKEPKPFDRIVRALVYTAIIGLLANMLVFIVGKRPWWPQPGSHGWLLATSLLVFVLSLLVGLLLAIAANNNWPHRWLARFPMITREAVHDSNLSYAMNDRERQYIVLILRDGRRVFGYPSAWPSQPDEDFFYLADHEWLEGEDDHNDADGTKKPDDSRAIAIAAKDVLAVEFVSDKDRQDLQA